MPIEVVHVVLIEHPDLCQTDRCGSLRRNLDDPLTIEFRAYLSVERDDACVACAQMSEIHRLSRARGELQFFHARMYDLGEHVARMGTDERGQLGPPAERLRHP